MYNNENFHAFFAQHGIQMCFSRPHTSQQNGKFEFMLRAINNVVRTLLFHAQIPPTYWVETFHMSTHLLNILPTSTLDNHTPFHKLFKQPPSYTHLQIYGCLCFPNIVPGCLCMSFLGIL